MKEQSRFPAAGSTAPLSSMGTVGEYQPHHHLGSACAPRQHCLRTPPAHHSWALSVGAPHALFSPVQGDNHHYIPLAPVSPACSLAHGTHTAATAFGASWLQNRASVTLLGRGAPALPWPAELVRVQHCKVQEPYPAVQETPLQPRHPGTLPCARVPLGDRDASIQPALSHSS